jgi:hypothetical protein
MTIHRSGTATGPPDERRGESSPPVTGEPASSMSPPIDTAVQADPHLCAGGNVSPPVAPCVHRATALCRRTLVCTAGLSTPCAGEHAGG